MRPIILFIIFIKFINAINDRAVFLSFITLSNRRSQIRVFRNVKLTFPIISISETWVDASCHFDHHYYQSRFSLVQSNLVQSQSRFDSSSSNRRFFSWCKSCRPVILKRLPSGIFPPHHLEISNRNSCTYSFSKGGMLELETSRTFDSSISRRFCYTRI